MKNSSKRLCGVLKSIGKFVDKEFSPLSENDKIKKSGELLMRVEFIKKNRNDVFVVLYLPEGVRGAIDSQGRLCDVGFNFIKGQKI